MDVSTVGENLEVRGGLARAPDDAVVSQATRVLFPMNTVASQDGLCWRAAADWVIHRPHAISPRCGLSVQSAELTVLRELLCRDDEFDLQPL